jgi:hypothetical protein
VGNTGNLWNVYLMTAKAALGTAFKNADVYLAARKKGV